MSKSTKGKAVARYLSANSGIPTLFYDISSDTIDGPPPFRFKVITDRNTTRFFRAIREEDIPIIRYDRYIESIDEAYVGIKLSAFATILGAYYDSLRDRVQTYIEGD